MIRGEEGARSYLTVCRRRRQGRPPCRARWFRTSRFSEEFGGTLRGKYLFLICEFPTQVIIASLSPATNLKAVAARNGDSTWVRRRLGLAGGLGEVVKGDGFSGDRGGSFQGFLESLSSFKVALRHRVGGDEDSVRDVLGGCERKD